jgi:hypothetical protein
MPRRKDGVKATPTGIPIDHRCRRRESRQKQPTRGGEEDVTMTITKCDGDGQFRGWLVAVVLAIVVVVIQRPPGG